MTERPHLRRPLLVTLRSGDGLSTLAQDVELTYSRETRAHTADFGDLGEAFDGELQIDARVAGEGQSLTATLP